MSRLDEIRAQHAEHGMSDSDESYLLGQVDELRAALQESRKWIGNGECSDGLSREHWTPSYAAAVDLVDVALANSGKS